MTRRHVAVGEPLVDFIEHDLACGIALGFFEYRRARVTLEAVTLYDRNLRVRDLKSNWLGTDPLDQATREYLEARRALMRIAGAGGKDAWSSPATAEEREDGLAQVVRTTACADVGQVGSQAAPLSPHGVTLRAIAFFEVDLPLQGIAWHTRGDTADRCSALSLAKVGWVIQVWLEGAVR